MSEYQYYEFLAVDRPLDERQQAEVRALSTRARVTATSFTNEYHWGNFRGDPRKMMERYYDAHLYLTNWGTHQVMLRLPRALLSLQAAEQYCIDPHVAAWASGEHLVLDLVSEDESGDWVEGAQDSLSAIVGVRAELATGDVRPLYLAWLANCWTPPQKPVTHASGGPGLRRHLGIQLPSGNLRPYLPGILARCSVRGPGGVIQIQIALDGFPQVMLGITTEPAMLAAPVMIPVGGVHRAQAAQRRSQFLRQLLPPGLR
jgi:hypothetical protein